MGSRPRLSTRHGLCNHPAESAIAFTFLANALYGQRPPLHRHVAIACLAVVLSLLLVGVGGFAPRGGAFNAKYANKIMRLRILAQFVAVVLIVVFFRMAHEAGWLSRMVVLLNRIYTRTGDKGQDFTRRRNPRGEGRPRASPSTARSTSSTPRSGWRACMPRAKYEGTALERIQNDLFDLGADLSTPDFENDATAKRPRLRIVAEQVARIEDEIDAMNAGLDPLRSFVLPGGTPPGRAPPPLPDRLPPRRAACDRARSGRGGQSRGGALFEPAFRLALRRSPGRERRRAGGTCSGCREPTGRREAVPEGAPEKTCPENVIGANQSLLIQFRLSLNLALDLSTWRWWGVRHRAGDR